MFTASSSEATDIALDSLCQRSYIRSSNGTLLATLHGEENREPVTLDEVPQSVIDAILAVEDQDFYSHNGINLRATLRALLENVDTGEVSPGWLDHHPAAGQAQPRRRQAGSRPQDP